MSDRRSADREKVIARVEILEPDGAVALVASVYNFSETGMMLGTPADYWLPERITMRLMGSEAVFPARVVWRRTGLAGLTFTEWESDAPPDVGGI